MDCPTQRGACRTNRWGRAPIGQSAEPIGSAACPKVRRTHWVLRRTQWARQNPLGLGKIDLAEPIGTLPHQWVRRNAFGFGEIDSFRRKNRWTRSCHAHWHDCRTNRFGGISLGSAGFHSVRQNLMKTHLWSYLRSRVDLTRFWDDLKPINRPFDSQLKGGL